MATSRQGRERYEGELARIDRAIQFTCWRNGLPADEAEEFRSEVHLHFIEGEYAVLESLEDPEALPAFLAVVIQRLMLDFRARRWGRWRPSRAARRAGEVGIRLETLVLRDGIDFSQAYEILRRNFGVTEGREELWALLQSFPARHGLASTAEVAMEEGMLASNEGGPEERLAEADHRATEDAVARCLLGGLSGLAAEDRLLLRMIYLDGHKISTAARLLGLEQRPLYRRLERLHGALRRHLEEEGITADRLRDFLESGRGPKSIDLTEIFGEHPSSSLQEGSR